MATFAGQATLRAHFSTGAQNIQNHRVQAFTASNPSPGDNVDPSADAPFELAAGETVTLHTVSYISTRGPNGQDLLIWVSVYEDDSDVVAMPEVQVYNNPSTSTGEKIASTVDFTPTKAGTYRLRLRVIWDSNGSSIEGGYTGTTDGAWSRQGTTPLWSNSPSTDKGYLRSGVALASIDIDNSTAFDGAPVPFAWHDRVRLRATSDVAAVANSSSLVIDADTTELGARIKDTEIVASTSSTTWQDSGGTSLLGNNESDFGIVLGLPANSTLSGRPWLHFESVPVGWTLGSTDGGNATTKSTTVSLDTALAYDPTLHIDHHLQVNDNTYDQALSVISRLTADLGFVSFEVTNARGELVNGITATETLTDDGNLVAAAINRSVTTQANGRPPSMAAWDSALPGGGWTHTVTITGPADAVGLEEPTSETWSLLAINPNIGVIVGAGSTTLAAEGDHWSPGSSLLVGVALYDSRIRTLVAPDADPSPHALLGRFRQDLGYAEYLDENFDWQILGGAEATIHPLMQSPSDPRVWITTLAAEETAAWVEPTIDLFVIGSLFHNGTPYWNVTSLPVLAANHKHSVSSRPEIDPVGLALSGIISHR